MNEDPKVIGVCGYAGAGKDEVGRFLVERHGYRRAAFADRVRAFLMAQNVWVDVPIGLVNADGKDIVRWVRLVDLVRRGGWDEAKQVPEVRRLMQYTATEAARKVLAEDIWVFSAFQAMNNLDPDAKWVITDLRFPNEAEAIKNSQGMIWRIRRPEHGPLNGHVSESFVEQLPADIDVGNSGTLDDLSAAVDSIMATVRAS